MWMIVSSRSHNTRFLSRTKVLRANLTPETGTTGRRTLRSNLATTHKKSTLPDRSLRTFHGIAIRTEVTATDRALTFSTNEHHVAKRHALTRTRAITPRYSIGLSSCSSIEKRSLSRSVDGKT
mmetsp:Transcript_32406/g.65157  ORF Transcript_32406/g.65157 Transcript_32406/m.65157 type:complete len:123 (+) Transcript_32406:174-542(+)